MTGKNTTKHNARIISKAHVHLQRKHVQSFKQISTKLYKELFSRGTHCLYIEAEN